MKVILLNDVSKVGNRHQIKELKDGFAQNVLISRGLAVMATPKNLANLEKKKLEMSYKENKEFEVFAEIIHNLKDKKIIIKAKANEKGRLFKSVNRKDICLAIKDSFQIEINENYLIFEPVKEIGFHLVKIKRGNLEGKFEIEIVSF
jgi:large subunit ribosomal protein L9